MSLPLQVAYMARPAKPERRTEPEDGPVPGDSAPGELTGRDRELAVLTGMIGEVTGQGGAVITIGEAGIGKSSLLAAAARHGRERGLRS